MRRLLLPLLLIAGPALAQSPDRPAPAPAPAKPDPKRAELDNLLNALKIAPSEAAAAAVEMRVREIWLRAGSPAAALLVARGSRNLANNAEEDALGDFDAALVLDPNYAEAYSRRAQARFAVGDYRGALIDIQETLKREPRHFAALQALSRIAEQRGDYAGALAAWQKVLDLDPKTPDGQERLKALQKKALGEES